MFKHATIILLTLLLGISSCNKKQSSESAEKPVARVFDRVLYPSDLKNIVPKDISAKDSAILISNFIEKWIQDELVMAYAQKNLSEEQLDIEKQIDEYRKNLIIYSYQTELIRQKLDTNVSDQEIENYYNSHLSNFQLKDNIVKVCYVKVNKQAPNIDKVRKWYLSDQPKDQENLKSYCIQFAENFFLDDNTWLLFDDILKEVPISDFNPELFLKGSKNIELNDSLNIYFLRIKKFMIKNDVSPIGFERTNIKNIIINKRKLDLIDEMKRNIYNDAKDKKDFEVYH